MARIIYTLGELAGSIGANTFQRNTSGTIVRSKPMVSRTSTIKQQQKHQFMQGYLKAWQLLTSGQRDQWNVFASAHYKINKFNQRKYLTGQNWFMSLNARRTYTGQPQMNVPPAYVLPAASPVFSLDASPSALLMSVDNDFDWDNNFLILWMGLPTLRQKGYVNNLRKFAGQLTIEHENPIDITTAWEGATEIDWDPVNIFPNTNIFVCVQSLSKSSSISAPMLCAKVNSTATITEGFGYSLFGSSLFT